MSEKIYDVPADWAKRAWADQAKYLALIDLERHAADSSEATEALDQSGDFQHGL